MDALKGDAYVYVCFTDNVPVYVGKGSSDRLNHCKSGASHNSKLNRDLFTKGVDRMSVTKVASGVSHKVAYQIEKLIYWAYIRSGFELYNNRP